MSRRLKVLTQAVEVWFCHHRVSDHDKEVKSEIPDMLCLILGYSLTLDTTSLYATDDSLQELIEKIIEALHLIYSRCSNGARDDSLKSVGDELLPLIVQVLEHSLSASYDRGLEFPSFNESSEVQRTNSIILTCTQIFLAFSASDYSRVVVSNHESVLNILSKISCYSELPKEIRKRAICVISNIANDEFEDDLNIIIARRTKKFFDFSNNSELIDESFKGKAHEYVEAALWNLSSDRDEKDVHNFLNSVAKTLNDPKSDLGVQWRIIRLLRCLSFGNMKLAIAKNKDLIRKLAKMSTETHDEEHHLQITECLSFTANGIMQRTSEADLVLDSLINVVCDPTKSTASRVFCTKGLRHLSRTQDVKFILKKWPYLLDALIDISSDDLEVENTLTGVETFTVIASEADSSMDVYDKIVTSLTKIMSIHDTKCTELVVNVLYRQALNSANRVTIGNHPKLLEQLASVACDTYSSISVIEKTTKVFANLASELTNGEHLAKPAILSALVKVTSMGGEQYGEARKSSVIALIHLASLVTNRRLMATQVGLLTSLIRYIRSEPASDLTSSLNEAIKNLAPVFY